MLTPNFYFLEGSLAQKYNRLHRMFENGDTWVIQNCNKVFGPYPRGNVPWDISEAQQYANSDTLKDLLFWVNTRIVLNLGKYDCGVTRKTYDVLLRIATGMLNKLDIPNEYKLMFHMNMTQNVHHELDAIMNESLPFLSERRRLIKTSPITT